MGLFGKDKRTDVYDRDAIWKRAEAFEKKGDRVRAAAEYQKVLRAEPRNLALQAKVGILLGEAGRSDEAWPHLQAAAEGHRSDGFLDKAAALYGKAAGYLPGRVDLWLTLAEVQLRRGYKADAVKACLDGRRHFRRLEQHHQAAKLLQKVLDVEPFHVEATLDLARLRRQTGAREDAKRLLHGLAARHDGRTLRRVRAAQVWLAPTPAAMWRWARAAALGR